MINFKVSGISAGSAFLLSFLIGLLSGSSLLIVCIRALIFGVLFFGLTVGAFFCIQTFLPDLFNTVEDTSASIQKVDISVDDSLERPVQDGDKGEIPPVISPEFEESPGDASVAQSSGVEIADSASPEPRIQNPSRSSSARKKTPLDKDYDPSVIASAIQTMLRKDG
ncbi:MAG: hypothetical protein LBQ77_02155 [Treponema sp.]|jgi:hypothetical protein|nr:hypothetical protein [Treponema sp.]